MIFAFLFGMMIGAMLGVVLTCMLAVASDADDGGDAW